MGFSLLCNQPNNQDVRGYADYLERQSLAVLKRVCSMYPYECKSGKSLQSESAEVSSIMVRLLQEKANVAGCRIVSYELADLQYAPEIAPGMLVRQQAEALVDARHSNITLFFLPARGSERVTYVSLVCTSDR